MDSPSLCRVCDQTITERIEYVLGEAFHHDCLHFRAVFNPAVLEHYHDDEGEKFCAGCACPLEQAQFIVANRKAYHIDHFVCRTCNVLLTLQTYRYGDDGDIYCHDHYSFLFSRRCKGCATSIVERQFVPEKHEDSVGWHMSCFLVQKVWGIKFRHGGPSTSSLETRDTPARMAEDFLLKLSSYRDKTREIVTALFHACLNAEHVSVLEIGQRYVLLVEALLTSVGNVYSKAEDSYADGGSFASTGQELYCNSVTFFDHSINAFKRSSRKLRRAKSKHVDLELVRDIIANVDALIKHGLTTVYRKILQGTGQDSSMFDFADRLQARSSITSLPFLTEYDASYPLDEQSSGYWLLAETRKEVKAWRSTPVREYCNKCNTLVEGECVQFRDYVNCRWHPACLYCVVCGVGLTGFDATTDRAIKLELRQELISQERPAYKHNVLDFMVKANEGFLPSPSVHCRKHAESTYKAGFKRVSNAEQYVFLLLAALNRFGWLHYRNGSLRSVRDAEGPFANAEQNQDKGGPEALVDNSGMASAEQIIKTCEPPDPIIVAGPPTIDPNEDDAAPFESNTSTTTASLPEPRPHLREDSTLEKQPPFLDADQSSFVAALTSTELALVKHAAFLTLVRSSLLGVVNVDDALELIQLPKNEIKRWQSLFGTRTLSRSSKPNKKAVCTFGENVDLKQLIRKDGKGSRLGASTNVLRIPSFLDAIVAAMFETDMCVQGVFLRSGNIRQIHEMIDSINKKSDRVEDVLSGANAITLTALLKRFLRGLSGPLLTETLSPLFIAAASLTNIDDRTRLLRRIFLLLPQCNRDAAELLFVFFKWFSSLGHYDQARQQYFDLAEMARIFGPSFLQVPMQGMPSETATIAETLSLLLEDQDELFRIPSDYLQMISDVGYFVGDEQENGTLVTGKELLIRIDSYEKQNIPTASFFSFSIPPSVLGSVVSLIPASPLSTPRTSRLVHMSDLHSDDEECLDGSDT